MKRISKKEKLLELGAQLVEEIDEGVEIFCEERPKAFDVKPRGDLADAKLKNRAKVNYLCHEITKYK